jgi:hypothetical protein
MKPTQLVVFTALLLLLAAYFGFSGHPLPAPEKPAVSSPQAAAPATPSAVESPSPEARRDPGPLTMTAAEAMQAPRQPDLAKVIAFNDWADRWQAATPAGREAMRSEGLQLATERRPEMKALIVTNPRMALDHAVARVILQDLPAEITAHLEKPVSATGDLNVYRGRPEGPVAPGTDLTLRYFETPDGSSYKARVSSELETVNSKQGVPLRGVAIDREMAVASNPVRSLERGERIPRGAKVEAFCPVSKTSTPEPAPEEPVTDETPTVEIGERIIRLCNGSHVRVLEDESSQLLMATGNPGAGFFYDTHPGTSSRAIGNFRCLYIRITYPDQLKAPNTEDRAHSDMRDVSRFFLENSFGRMTTTSAVTPVITLPYSQAWYIAKDSEVDGLGLVHSHARAEARKLGYDPSQFNCTIVRVNGGPRLSGISWGGGDRVWVTWNGMDVLNHECGHSLGRNHANYWQTSDGSAIGVGANQEYGNGFDVMGGGGGFPAHYNSKSKRDLGWLDDSYVHRPSASPAASGVYRIHAYDQPQLETGKRYALRVEKDAQRRFYLEYHPAYNTALANSVLMIVDGLGSNCGHLIDTTPGSAGGKGDGGITVGRTFSDFESDIHFTVLSKNATTPPSMDVAYQRGPFPGNQPPTLSISASATTIATGGSITFTATAADPDNDTLAYHWDFNDGVVSTNTPVFTRTFSSTDQMTVLCTVSDMKGGTTRRHVVVNVGNHGRGIVTGRITANGQPVAGVRVTSDNSKYCFTDSNGDYSISDLTGGARTLTAALTGYTFTPSFTNPITAVVNSTVPAADWTAASVTEVGIAATDAAEGGAAGSFVLTRSGDTSAALDVTVTPVGGLALKTTASADYTFSPDYVASGSLYKFTIPAGQASLTVNVAAVNDALQEGPETVKLQLSVGTYQVRSSGVAVLTIADDDTTLPVVSAATTDLYASEAAGDQGGIVLSRTGSTAAALNVAVAWSGTAANGTDYTSLPTTVQIPAGQASTTLTLSAVNDALVEGLEDATLTISNNAAYIRDTTAQTATVTITDDDVPVVSVTASDASASEANRDPGLLLITRSGPTTAPLTVYYGVAGSALHGTDYQALTGQIVIPAGSASVPVVITPYDDDLGEGDPETVTFNLTTYNGVYQLGTAYGATVNIADNDDLPMISVRANTTAAEPSTTGNFIIRALGSATGDITVNYTLSGTATTGSDYTAPTGSVTLSAASANEVTVNIPVLNDSLPEDTETVVMTLAPGAGYRIFNDGSASIRLEDEDSGDRVMVSAWHEAVTEAVAATNPKNVGKFYFSRKNTAGDLTVSYAIGGTAINGSDYSSLSGTVTIPDGASGTDVAFTSVNDTLVEGTETVTVTVLGATGYGVDIPSTATLYLTEDETPPVSVGYQTATGTTTEAPGTLGEYRDIAVNLTAASTDAVTVEYTSGGGTATGDDIDWTFVDAANANTPIPGGTLVFPPGTTSQTVRIKVRNDGVAEGNETIILDLNNARFARLSSTLEKHTLTVSDANDPPARIRFVVASTTRGEGDGTEPLLMAVLDRPLAATATVNYSASGTASAGSDYTLAPGPLTFAPGETVKLLPFSLLTDGVPELAETVAITLADPSNSVLGTPATHTITISDSNRPSVTIAGPAEARESAGTVEFTINRPGATTLPLEVFFTTGGTAVAPGDFAPLPASVILPIGESSVTLPVAITDDATEEADEPLVLTLSANPNYDLGPVSQTTTTLIDDDAPPVIAITSPVRSEVAIPNGTGLVIIAQATRETAGGNVAVPIVWSTLSGPGIVTFESTGATTTSATFSAPGDYLLQAGATVDATTVTKEILVQVGRTLTAQTIGTTTAAGSWSESDSIASSLAGGTLTVTGASTGISSTGTSDGFYFLAAPRSGDFDIRVRVASRTNPGGSNSCRIGLMARASTATNAPYAFSHYRGNGVHSYQARLNAGSAPYSSTGSELYTLPRYLRLVRSGDNFSAYHSADGITWTLRGATQSIPAMGPAPLVGIAVTSAVTATAATAVLDQANFHLPTNIGPAVNAGAALAGSGPWNLDATVSDDARPAPLATLWQPEGGVNFTNSSSPDTAVSFDASGNYRLRLTAGDGAITTFDDTTADVTAGSPLLSWRDLHFGTTDGSGDAANLADKDQDGLENLIEYALLTSPVQSNPSPFTLGSSPGQITLTLGRDPSRNDVSVFIEASATLTGTWSAIASSSSGGAFVPLAPDVTIGETGSGPVAVTATVNTLTGPPARFFRVRVESTVP